MHLYKNNKNKSKEIFEVENKFGNANFGSQSQTLPLITEAILPAYMY
jgi:hypothetical protein